MNAVEEKLLHLRVSDVMTTDVVTVTVGSTMSEAADVLSDHKVTGAPVIDQQGRCIGVLSGTDYVYSKASEFYAHAPTCCDLQTGALLTRVDAGSDLVRRHMSPDVRTIKPDCSLVEAARRMCEGHIHRLIVTDDQGAVVGLLTSLDLIAAWIGTEES